MSYINPNTETLSAIDNIGINAPIESIRTELKALPWLSKSFGRAYTFTELIGDKPQKIPKCYTDSGEYINVLPNDTLFTDTIAASSFIRLNGSETYDHFNKWDGSEKKAKLSIIFWCNLKLIDSEKDYIFTEDLKNDVEQILKLNQHVFELVEWFDERLDDVFNGYDLNYSDLQAQYLMYPYSGFRVDVTVIYPEACL